MGLRNDEDRGWSSRPSTGACAQGWWRLRDNRHGWSGTAIIPPSSGCARCRCRRRGVGRNLVMTWARGRVSDIWPSNFFNWGAGGGHGRPVWLGRGWRWRASTVIWVRRAAVRTVRHWGAAAGSAQNRRVPPSPRAPPVHVPRMHQPPGAMLEPPVPPCLQQGGRWHVWAPCRGDGVERCAEVVRSKEFECAEPVVLSGKQRGDFSGNRLNGAL